METLSTKEVLKLQDIPERTEGLSSITRYSLYSVMYYRGTILEHTLRVAALVEELGPLAQATFGEDFDLDRTRVLALVHDDPEIIIGDIQAGNKAKMSEEQAQEVQDLEIQAADKLAAKFPAELEGYNYRSLLQEIHDGQTIEAQFIKYLDKYDAFGEALHEIHAGNICFVTNVENGYGRIQTPAEYYIEWFAKMGESYPQMAPLFNSDFPIAQIPEEKDFCQIAASSKPHDLGSLRTYTGYTHYDFWKATMLKHQDTVNIQKLCTQIEFLN